MGTRVTLVDRVTEQIAFRIASGAYPAGSKLPSVRALASELDINASTVQVVLGRLQEAGFVEAHQGVGFLVRDIQLLGGIETWPYLFRFSQQLPDLASRMLGEIMSMRNTLLAEAVRTIAEEPLRYDPTPVRRAVDHLDLLLVGTDTPDGLMGFARAELHVLRVTLRVAGRNAALAVLNSVGRLMLEVPEAVEAMMHTPHTHGAFWRAVLDMWGQGSITDEAIARAEHLVSEGDAVTLQAFRELITQRQIPAASSAPRVVIS